MGLGSPMVETYPTMERLRRQRSGVTRAISRNLTRLLCAAVPLLGVLLLGGCGSRAASLPSTSTPTPTPTSIRVSKSPLAFADEVQSSDRVVTQVLASMSAAGSSCPSAEVAQSCLASTAARGEVLINQQIQLLDRGPRPPAQAKGAFSSYLSNLENLRTEMHELSVGNPGIQADVLTITLPVATRQYQAFSQALTSKVGVQSA